MTTPEHKTAPWLDMRQWAACANPALREDDFLGESCVIAIDAAFGQDFLSKLRLFRRGPLFCVFGRHYMAKQQQARVVPWRAARWARDGWIHATPGRRLDTAAVQQELCGAGGDLDRFDVRHVAFDPGQLAPLAARWRELGVPAGELRPTLTYFSPAMKRIAELVDTRRLQHNGDPVLGWALASVVRHPSGHGCWYPVKSAPGRKIDPAIALIMAMARAHQLERRAGDLQSAPTAATSFAIDLRVAA